MPSTVTCATVRSICGSIAKNSASAVYGLVSITDAQTMPVCSGSPTSPISGPSSAPIHCVPPAMSSSFTSEQRGHHQPDELPVGLEHIGAELAQFGAQIARAGGCHRRRGSAPVRARLICCHESFSGLVKAVSPGLSSRLARADASEAVGRELRILEIDPRHVPEGRSQSARVRARVPPWRVQVRAVFCRPAQRCRACAAANRPPRSICRAWPRRWLSAETVEVAATTRSSGDGPRSSVPA